MRIEKDKRAEVVLLTGQEDLSEDGRHCELVFLVPIDVVPSDLDTHMPEAIFGKHLADRLNVNTCSPIQDDPLRIEKSLCRNRFLIGAPGLQPMRMGAEGNVCQVAWIYVGSGKPLLCRSDRYRATGERHQG